MNYNIKKVFNNINGNTAQMYKYVWYFVCVLFFFSIFIAFPLYFYNKYLDMAYHKWTFYVTSMVLFLMVMVPIGLGGLFIRKDKKRLAVPDYFAIAYGVLAFITYANCSNPKAAFMGTDGWYMGFVAQIMFVISYMIFSRRQIPLKIAVLFNCVGSLACFIVAIFQRYGKDLLHLYWEMPDEIVRDYLSTIGNRTWFSAYVCTVFPLGLYLFYKAQNKRSNVILGIYTLISFCCIVTINSDSAYAGIMVVFLIIFLFSIGDSHRMKRLGYILMMWFAACLVMTVLRIPFEQYVRDLRGLSKLFLNVKTAIPGILLSGVILGVSHKYKDKINGINKIRWQCIWICVTMAGVLGLILVIALNTSGVFQKCLGFTIQNQYLFFDDAWGDHRGGSWKLTFEMFMDLPFGQKLVGVGPDCFAYHAYSNKEYSQVLYNMWGESVLANAHNEWLNSIFCMGILGGTAYLAIFISVMIHCLRKEEDASVHEVVPAIGLCVASYIAHNFFCYQQASATGVIFVLMGIAMYYSKPVKSVNKSQKK